MTCVALCEEQITPSSLYLMAFSVALDVCDDETCEKQWRQCSIFVYMTFIVCFRALEKEMIISDYLGCDLLWIYGLLRVCVFFFF